MSRDLIHWLQKYKRNSVVYKTLFDAISPELDTLDNSITDLTKQLSVGTATWGLPIYEAELDVPINNTSKPINERRSVIIAKMRGQGKFDAKMIKDIVASWEGGAVDVTFTDSVFNIQFIDIYGAPTNLNDITMMLNEIKPAHLDIRYTYRYNQYQHLATYTYGYLQQFTNEQLYSSKLD